MSVILDGVKQSMVIPKVSFDQEATYSVKLGKKTTETQLKVQGNNHNVTV